MTDPEQLLRTYPRHRPHLPEAYRRIYEREYRLNRTGVTRIAKLVQSAESWMHRVVARYGKAGSILELGAGTLNHVPYEQAEIYDVVEPFDALYGESAQHIRVRHRYRDIREVPPNIRYDRIISIAVLEHLENLPEVIACSALLLAKDGQMQHCIPSEGGALWGAGWRATTGLSYWLRNRLPYGVLMRYEHINSAEDIITLMRWFFSRTSVIRFPLPAHHLSLYTYISAECPRLDRCRRFAEAISQV
ncbi:MAG: methyltransferase domain-containing protein [Chromatiales bacterium]